MNCMLKLGCCLWLVLICVALPSMATAQQLMKGILKNGISIYLPAGWREATIEEYAQIPDCSSSLGAIIYDSAQGVPLALIMVKANFYPPALYQLAMKTPEEVAQAMNSDTIRLVSQNNPVDK